MKMFMNNQYLDTTNSQEETTQNSYKQVEYYYIEKQQYKTQVVQSELLEILDNKRLVPIVRPLNQFYNGYLLGNDLYINLDLILNKESYEQQHQIINQFKQLKQINWNQKRSFVQLHLETNQKYVYDYSLMLYQLSSLQNSRYAQCIIPLKQYEQYCIGQYKLKENLQQKDQSYAERLTQYFQEKNESVINSIQFENKYIFILQRGFDQHNNQVALQSIYYSEILLDLIGIFHGLKMFGIERTEMTNLLNRLGVYSIFNDINSMEYSLDFFINQNERKDEQIQNKIVNFDFQTLDNIRVQCQGKRIQHNINLDIDRNLDSNHNQLLTTNQQIIYELFISKEQINKINAQRIEQLRYFSKLTDKLKREEAKQFCMNGQYPEECKHFLTRYYKDIFNKEVKNINSNFYDLSWLNNL
ncbi:hypothetical protein TTHERM_00189420 (macronuclear) [Tetrahymena thermophila SB210]|uniref:Uncharacterized protein n=1 Tax=Tetrahymena thermophila (strain SB210) TaxID=312017 RepID=I7MEH6_TETTS|nr:hypothetical protein TTHERM_00189420 [Tetrahymena thermophila SB210]EAR96373.2 hypothetical protein TTHERM_00189420 [Tetrahymena thermophila SB210]|eukprot:XP_001016618.2 hypothetical protein TTHERM_00189420 [Tetrahymena thermophila SB210]